MRSLQRLDVLDGMRGFAVLLVVWYHLWLVSGFVFPFAQVPQLFVESGFLGVDIFFFVSGFCICFPYAKAFAAGKPLPTWREFARRRALKIVPSYLLALAVFALAYHANFGSTGEFVASLAAHVAFVHVWFPQTFGSLSGPLWTIGVEVQFYVMFGLLAAVVVRRPLVAYLASALIAESYRAIVAWTGNDTDFALINQLPAVLDVFGAGMLAASIFVAVAKARARTASGDAGDEASADDASPAIVKRIALFLDGSGSQALRDLRAMQSSVVAFLAIALVIAGFGTITLVGRLEGIDAVHRALDAGRVAFGPALLIVTLGVALGAKPLHDAIANAPLRALSLVSYNAYLWNLEVSVWLQSLGLAPWAIFVFGATLTGALSVIVTYEFEQPILEHGIGGFAVIAQRLRDRAVRIAALATPLVRALRPRIALLLPSAPARPALRQSRGELARAFQLSLERASRTDR